MPEGHVIHRLAKELNRNFQGTAPLVTSPQGRFSAEAALVDGQDLVAATAWGKQLFIEFDIPNPENIIYIHLGLIGSFNFEDPDTTRGQIRLHIANDDIAANLRGPQWCRLIDAETAARAQAKLGADPLRADADPSAILQKVSRSRQPIGALLMDQHLFAGVGNIYRAESLFRLGIHPDTPGKDVTQLQELWQDLVELMACGVEVGKIDTVRPEHTPEAMGRQPRKDDHGGEVYVYRRAGQPCYICGTEIAQTVMQGRNLFWCPTCQPAPR
ncbi:MAG: zinc finger domain-containing protein [Corynebacterium sp.]|nr:zinc finger domain-containing protein [Corynebacterium sp.]